MLEDIEFQASLKGLTLQFKGGLTIEENPTLFPEREEAAIEPYGRLVALRAAHAIARNGSGANLQNATRIEIYHADGMVLVGADVAGEMK